MTDTTDIARRLGALETKVEVLRGAIRFSSPDDEVQDVFWEDFPADQKWRVAWGSWWRMAVLQLALFAGVVVVSAALVNTT